MKHARSIVYTSLRWLTLLGALTALSGHADEYADTNQLVRANNAPEKGTGWHRHEADFQIVIMLKGWARFMYEDQVTLVEAGDCVHQRPGTWGAWVTEGRQSPLHNRQHSAD